MREKLIELISDNGTVLTEGDYGEVADHLLANGVIVLPCRVEQKIYAIGKPSDVRKIKECEAEEFIVYKQKSQVLAGFECDNDCESCPFNSWVQEVSGGWSCDGEYGQAMIDFDDFGKTVFLTREEAEAALKEGKG